MLNDPCPHPALRAAVWYGAVLTLGSGDGDGYLSLFIGIPYLPACGHTHCCVAIAPDPGELICLAPLCSMLDFDIEVVQPVATDGGTERVGMVYAATIPNATGWLPRAQGVGGGAKESCGSGTCLKRSCMAFE